MKRLRRVIESVFDEDYDQITTAQNFRDIESWDSLKYLQLIVAIQSEFGIELNPQEIPQITSVGGILGALKAKGVEP